MGGQEHDGDGDTKAMAVQEAGLLGSARQGDGKVGQIRQGRVPQGQGHAQGQEPRGVRDLLGGEGAAGGGKPPRQQGRAHEDHHPHRGGDKDARRGLAPLAVRGTREDEKGGEARMATEQEGTLLRHRERTFGGRPEEPPLRREKARKDEKGKTHGVREDAWQIHNRPPQGSREQDGIRPLGDGYGGRPHGGPRGVPARADGTRHEGGDHRVDARQDAEKRLSCAQGDRTKRA